MKKGNLAQFDLFSGSEAAAYNTDIYQLTELDAIESDIRQYPCRACGDLLPEHPRAPVVYKGCADAPIVIIGQGPGPDEADRGKPFTGRSGRYLRDLLIRVNVHPVHDVVMTNVAWCYFNRPSPPDRAFPHCRANLEHLVKVAAPSAILTLGLAAAQNTILFPPGVTEMEHIIGRWWPNTIFHVPAFAIYHPAFLTQKAGKRYENLTIKQLDRFVRNCTERGVAIRGYEWCDDERPVDDPEVDEPKSNARPAKEVA